MLVGGGGVVEDEGELWRMRGRGSEWDTEK